MQTSSKSSSTSPVVGIRILLLVALAGFGADQAGKAWAFAPGRGPDGLAEIIPGYFVSVPARNFGAMDNFAGGSPLTATVLALWGLVLIALAVPWAIKHRRWWRRCDAVGGGLLLAGMMGNSADRLLLGYVRDFLISRQWPNQIFNLADLLILLGALVLVLSWAARLGGKSRRESPPIPAAGAGEIVPASGA